jgi:hypothetical protein
MVPIVGAALKAQEPYVPGFPFPLLSVTVTRRLGMVFSVAGWKLTLAVSARAVPAPKHKTADAATPSADRIRLFVGLQRFTLRVLSAVASPPQSAVLRVVRATTQQRPPRRTPAKLSRMVRARRGWPTFSDWEHLNDSGG